MWRMITSIFICAPCLIPSLARADDKPLSSAEKLRQALDRVCDVEIADLPLDQAVNLLREQTGLNLRIDRIAVPPLPDSPSGGPGGVLIVIPAYTRRRLQGQFHGIPLRSALTKLLGDHDLTHVLVGDTILITAREKAADRQLGQMVSINVEGQTLSEELKRLARVTGANLVLDPRSAKESQTALTLRLDEVPLETAVEILADESGLSTVRLNNVLYVTSEARAKALRKPSPPATPSTLLGGGAMGTAGVGFAPPVPLTPPLPKVKPAAPDKKPPPAVSPANKEKPAPKDNSQAQAVRSRSVRAESARTRKGPS